MQGVMREFGGAKRPKNNTAVLKKSKAWVHGVFRREGFVLTLEGEKHPLCIAKIKI
jgi:hypothetical protein